MDNSPRDDHVFSCKRLVRVQLTWSAIARPSLSILDPASAIFFAALITSEVFLSGPFPLEKKDSSFIHSYCSVCNLVWHALASMCEHGWCTSRRQHVWHKNGWSYWQGWRKKKKQACFTASRSGTAQHEKGFLGKTRSVCFQLINLIKEEHPPPTRFHSLVAWRLGGG